jgi:hypothetical protein
LHVIEATRVSSPRPKPRRHHVLPSDPPWDFDDPAHALPFKLTETQRPQVFLENAKAVFVVR